MTAPAHRSAGRLEAALRSGHFALTAETSPPDAASAGPVLVKIETRRSQDALVQVIGCLNERDVAFTSIEIFEPNLESVFLHLTGKKLRE